MKMFQKNSYSSILVGLALLGMLSLSSGYNFLLIVPMNSQSHYYVGLALAKGLASAGHQVTFLSPYKLKQPIMNLNEIELPSFIPSSRKSQILATTKQPIMQNYLRILGMGLHTTPKIFEVPAVQDLMQSNQTFDAVICEVFVNDAHFGFAEHFNAPLIGFSTFGATTWNTDLVGTPSPPSYVPHALLKFTDHMSLYERLMNLVFVTFEYFALNFYYLPQQEQIYSKNFPYNKLTLTEARRNTALVLLNNHVSISFPRPYAPNMIEVGGMHINCQTKPLPADIKNFLNDAQHGVIYFSLGSNVKSIDLPLEKRSTILQTFRNLKQRILWKFEDSNLENKPDNVYISNWFPQTDILAHKNVIAFVTHGGLLSTTESIYHAKPLVGIPLFGDQHLNMARAVQYGYGLIVNYHTLTIESFSNAINSILNDPKYTQSAQEISKRFKRQKETPIERAIYWVEHVAELKGARYLRSAAQDLNFIEYHNIDAILIFFGGITYFLIAFIYCIYMLCRKLKKIYKKSTKKSTKKIKSN